MANIGKLIVEYIPFALVAYGLFYAILPHTVHQVYAPDWLLGINFPHEVHVTLGVILILVGGVMLILRRK